MHIDILNAALADDYNIEPYKLEDLKLITDLVKIVLSVQKNIEVPIYKCPMELKTSLEYAKKFLELLNINYKNDLEDAIDNGNVIFNLVDDSHEVSALILHNKNIKYNLTGYLFDVYSIVHELIHYTSYDVKNKSLNWILTTEAYAFVAESLLSNYLHSLSNDIPEIDLNDTSNLIGVIEKAYMLDFELELMKLYLDKKHISCRNLANLLKDKSDIYIEYALLDISNIKKRYDSTKVLTLNYTDYQTYIIGYLLATHILLKINNNKDYIKEYLYLIDNSNNMTFVDTLKRLDLEVIDEDNVILSDESIKVLKREYKKRVEDI